MGRTSIQVSDELADELYDRKGRGESYEDVIWRLIDRADATSSADGHQREQTDPADSTTAAPDTADTGERFDELDFPTTIPSWEEAISAIEAAEAYLRAEKAATKAEIVRNVMPDNSVGYDVEGALEKLESDNRYRGAWWRRVVRPGLAVIEDVEKPETGESEWKVSTDE